jgi:hypothetical protein
MDLKVLFHNPDELTDAELVQLSRKVGFQAMIPYYTAFFGGFSMYLFELKVAKRHHDVKRLAAASVVGLIVGAYGSYQTKATLDRKFDPEIIGAFDHRYAQTVVYASGYGSNYLNINDYSLHANYRKPY